MKTSLFLYVILAALYGCSGHTSQKPKFIYNDSAYIEVKVFNWADTTLFSFITTPLIPISCTYKEIEIVQNGTYIFSHKTIKPDFIELTLRKRFQTYLIPGDTLKIIANLDPKVDKEESIEIEGVFGEIGNFYSKKKEKLGYWDIHSVLSNIVNSNNNLERTFVLLDSVFQSEREFFNSYSRTAHLEDWFYQTISADIEYGRYFWNCIALYNRRFFHKEDQIDIVAYNIFENLSIYSPSAKFSRAYYDCIGYYFMMSNEAGLEDKRGLDRALPLLERSIPEAKNVLKGDVLEFFVAYKISTLFEGSTETGELQRVDSLLIELQDLFIHEEINEILLHQRERRSKFIMDKSNQKIKSLL